MARWSDLDSGNFDAIANAIVVANGNVYVAGEDYGYAVYWVNGQETRLNGAFVSSDVSSMAVSGAMSICLELTPSEIRASGRTGS